MHQTLTEVLRSTSHYLDTITIAELLSMKPDTINRYCREGFMPHYKYGKSFRFDPNEVADWVQSHQFSAGGNVADKVTDWVVAHVFDRTLNLPVPTALAEVLAALGEPWKVSAKASLNLPPTSDQLHPLVIFQACLNQRLTVLEQRELLAELLWLGVNCA